MRNRALRFLLGGLVGISLACLSGPKTVQTNPAVKAEHKKVESHRDEIEDHSEKMLKEGREIFRYDSFGSEEFWVKTRLHEAILGENRAASAPDFRRRPRWSWGSRPTSESSRASWWKS